MRATLIGLSLMLLCNSASSTTVLSLCAPVANEDSLARFTDGYPLNNPDTSLRGDATLTIKKARLQAGDAISAEALFRVGRGSASGWIFNPFQDALLPKSYVLVMYDSKKKLVCTWGDAEAGSRKGITPGCWAGVGPGSCAGAEIEVTPSSATGEGDQPPHLGAGTYYLQVVYRKAFIGLDTTKGGRVIVQPFDGEKLMEEFDKSELFRSNAVEIELTN